MKYWKYKIRNCPNIGTDTEPIWNEYFVEKMIPYSEANEEIAKKEAYNGEYEIYDDGQPDPLPSSDDVLNALLGVTE